MEAISGASNAAYRNLLGHPFLLTYFQQASPLQEIGMLNIGSRPARRFGTAASLEDLRAIPFVFAWAQNRHAITNCTASAVASRASCKSAAPPPHGHAAQHVRHPPPLPPHHRRSRKKPSSTVDLSVAREYAGLVVDADAAREIFSMVEREYRLTCEILLEITGAPRIASRFTHYSLRLASAFPSFDAVNREQVELLRRYRKEPKDSTRVALLRSINCIAAGFGATDDKEESSFPEEKEAKELFIRLGRAIRRPGATRKSLLVTFLQKRTASFLSLRI